MKQLIQIANSGAQHIPCKMKKKMEENYVNTNKKKSNSIFYVTEKQPCHWQASSKSNIEQVQLDPTTIIIRLRIIN